MSRLIDADALIISDEECVNTICRDCKMHVNGCEDFFDIIKNAPTIEPERKRGNWVGIDDEPCDDWECNRCGEIVTDCFYDGLPNFCPNCGADMRGGET